MGNGSTPGPSGVANPTPPVDDGTLARTRTPPPVTVGVTPVRASGGDAGPAERVVSFAKRNRGGRVGDGECFALADRALRAARLKSADAFGEITPDGDYVWGTAVTLAALAPGDIIQFRDYASEVRTDKPDGGYNTESQSRPHHTAIVETVGADGAVTLLEQNAPDGSPVTRRTLFFASGSHASGENTVTVNVTGQFWFYRPQPR